MSAAATSTLQSESWESLILSERPARALWSQIFKRLGEVALASSPSTLHRETVIPDRLIAESAWDLWQSFPTDAPKVIDAIRAFWTGASGSAGTAVLILDALSLRELPLIVAGANRRNIPITTISVCGAQVPTETDQFAAALGLPSRSKLFNNQPPASFIFAGADVHTDVLEEPFGDCVARIPAKPRLFIWHKWPDEPLIHDHSEQREGDTVVAAEIKRTLLAEEDKIITRVPIYERFQKMVKRSRREMKTELDQAHFLIGAAMPVRDDSDATVNIEKELERETFLIRPGVEALLDWYSRTPQEGDDQEAPRAATVALQLLRAAFEAKRARMKLEDPMLFEEWEASLAVA